MNLNHYEYLTNENFLDYEFYSEGPKGKIRKIIRFTHVILPDYQYYNLGFGDWNEEEQKINDFVTSNNHDAEMVLATVAHTVIDFTNRYTDALVYAEGSTSSRTRRYQMGINKFWLEIEPLFDVFGLVEASGFEPVLPGRNYKAFAVKRKMGTFSILSE